MKLFGFPVIKYDECLMSWLVRSFSGIGESSILQYISSLADPDFDLENEKVLDFLSGLGVGGRVARDCFGARTAWLLPWEERTAYCFRCLQEDISSGSSPYWRKSWCYLHNPICVKHRELLEIADPISNELQKSWTVFIQKCSEKYGLVPDFEISWAHPNRFGKKLMLALRVQDFLTRAHKADYIRLRGHDVVVSGAAVLAVARLLFESFLFPRLRPPCGDGIATGGRAGFPRTAGIISIEQARQRGCSDSNVHSRMTALILIGCVFKLFPLERFKDVRDALELTADVYSGEAYDIGRHGMRLSSSNEYKLTIEFLDGLPAGLKGCLGEFISGLNNSAPDVILG
ncbi:hypothetical protein [Pseudomonas sp. RW409]|uniref:hypothetical protein n=1 Tax=Pseudomonas sp. RW409 TaxID=2202895 RepID=UPI0011B7EF55|nr:hypothetical protein [Pseudomonas sp. RW409]